MVGCNEQEQKKIMQEMAALGVKLYRLMQDGQAVELTLPSEQKVIIPGQFPIRRNLIIFKPNRQTDIDIKTHGKGGG